MKKSRVFFVIAYLLLAVGFSQTAFATRAQAAKITNVRKAPKAKAGQWVASAKGYRYRYKATGKYAKNEWLKIAGKIYFFKSDGYVKTGFKLYDGKRYYFDKNGVLASGWKTIRGSKYYFSKVNGAAIVGKKKIGKYYYYFDKTGKRKTGWRKISGKYYYFNKSTGRMEVNKKIGKYYVDKHGRRTTTNPNANGKVDIFVGDSRTVGMYMSVSELSSSKCIAKENMGYDWFVNEAIPKLKEKLKKKPSATVVVNMGINDIDNCDRYLTQYSKLVKKYPKATFYFMSVNPVDSKYTWGSISYKKMKSKIQTFNKKLKNKFPDHYIDCYTYLTKEKKFKTSDGVHYTSGTYNDIYKYILTQI